MGYGCDVEDIGHDMAMADYLAELSIRRETAREDIKDDRIKREKALIGKYLVICDGNKSKKTVYLQDNRISKGGYWAQFKSNALGFKSKDDAVTEKNKFKYNNPRVVLVDSSMNLVTM